MTKPDINLNVATSDGRSSLDQPHWRRDFPVNVVDEQYVERRDFTKFLVLTSVAFVAGQISIGVRNWFRRRAAAPPIQSIFLVDQLGIGASIAFNYPTEKDPCIVTRTGENTYRAYSQACTHLSCSVIPDGKAGIIRCPCHDGVFDLESGRPLAGPPRRPLPLIRLEIRAGVIYATDVEVRTT